MITLGLCSSGEGDEHLPYKSQLSRLSRGLTARRLAPNLGASMMYQHQRRCPRGPRGDRNPGISGLLFHDTAPASEQLLPSIGTRFSRKSVPNVFRCHCLWWASGAAWHSSLDGNRTPVTSEVKSVSPVSYRHWCMASSAPSSAPVGRK